MLRNIIVIIIETFFQSYINEHQCKVYCIVRGELSLSEEACSLKMVVSHSRGEDDGPVKPPKDEDPTEAFLHSFS